MSLLLTSASFVEFLQVRKPFIQKLVRIHSLQAKDASEIRTILSELFEPIARTIHNEYFVRVKSEQVTSALATEVLAKVPVPKINTAYKRQFIFSNLSGDVLTLTQ